MFPAARGALRVAAGNTDREIREVPAPGSVWVDERLLSGLALKTGDTVKLPGAAGSIVLIMIWVYFSAHVFLFGAVFTRRYILTYGSLAKDSSNVEVL